jgi:hypothetical protein
MLSTYNMVLSDNLMLLTDKIMLSDNMLSDNTMPSDNMLPYVFFSWKLHTLYNNILSSWFEGYYNTIEELLITKASMHKALVYVDCVCTVYSCKVESQPRQAIVCLSQSLL